MHRAITEILLSPLISTGALESNLGYYLEFSPDKLLSLAHLATDTVKSIYLADGITPTGVDLLGSFSRGQSAYMNDSHSLDFDVGVAVEPTDYRKAEQLRLPVQAEADNIIINAAGGKNPPPIHIVLTRKDWIMPLE